MQIVTFNLRNDNDYDAENRWQFRKGIILDKISAESPDLMGFQEVKPDMADFLKKYLPEYAFVGCGRDADFGGENNMIAFKRSAFELMSLETFWLSPTPDVPGSRYANQSDCPRICTHVLLRPLDGGKLFHYYNTHLDHISDEARVLGAGALMRRIAEDLKRRDCPVIISGDMNAAPDSQAIQTFLTDAEVPLVNQTPDFPASWHDYGKRMDEPQIDYIFTRGFEAIKQPAAWDERPYGKFLSDHNALCAFLKAN